MSLNWHWNENVGTLKIQQTWDDGVHEWTLKLYEGNAFLIILNEDDENDTYTLYNFLADKEHLKNCVKNCPEIFDEWKELVINRGNYSEKKLIDLIKALSKVNPACRIILQ